MSEPAFLQILQAQEGEQRPHQEAEQQDRNLITFFALGWADRLQGRSRRYTGEEEDQWNWPGAFEAADDQNHVDDDSEDESGEDVTDSQHINRFLDLGVVRGAVWQVARAIPSWGFHHGFPPFPFQCLEQHSWIIVFPPTTVKEKNKTTSYY